MDRLIKWGIIGCGSVTEVKSGPAFNLVNGFKLIAVMRRNLDLAKDYATRHNVPYYYNDAEALLNNPDIDAVYIATPPDTHSYYALKVAEAGKICCIEKPMAPSYKECLEIQTRFSVYGLPLFVSYYRRSLPRFNKVKTLIEEQAIGDVRHISWYLSRTPSDLDKSKIYNWRTDAKIAPAGYFDDLACHGLDLFIFLFGEVINAQGMTKNQQKLYSAKDIIVGNWVHESGIMGSGIWSFGAYKREDKVRIVGSEGELTFSVFAEDPICLCTVDSIEDFQIENPKHIQYYHVKNMRLHLSNEIKHPSTGLTATHTAWVMDRILGT